MIRGRAASAMVWSADRVEIGELVLRLQYQAAADWDLGDRCMAFFKDRRVVELYDQVFGRCPDFVPRHIVELGMWDGGSVAFWHEYFEPELLLGFDLQKRGDSAYFSEWVARRGVGARIKTFWNSDQADRRRLAAVVDAELLDGLDLVVDDASHLYGPTLASFEVLFPRLRPGGRYVIEDWNWGNWPQHWDLPGAPLSRLVAELVEALGTNSGVVSSVEVVADIAVIERGPMALPTDGSFSVARHVRRRPWWRTWLAWATSRHRS